MLQVRVGNDVEVELIRLIMIGAGDEGGNLRMIPFGVFVTLSFFF